MGTPVFAVPSLEALAKEFKNIVVISQPDKPAGRGQKIKPTPVKEKALDLGLEVFQPEKKKDLENLVESLSPDIIVVVAYGKILTKRILDVPKFGTLNLHASLLPKYRGPAPIQRVLMAGEKITGNTVMLVNEEMDAGDILAQEVEPIHEEDNFYTLSERLARKGSNLLVRTLKDWIEGKITPKAQNHREATYAPYILKEEYRICWKASALSVEGRVRGLFPNAYTFIKGKRVKILKVKALKGEGVPGEVIDPQNFIVACGDGAVKVEELVSPKGKKVSAKEFLKGYPLRKGDRVGE